MFDQKLHIQLGKLMELKKRTLIDEIASLQRYLTKTVNDMNQDDTKLPDQCGIIQGRASKIETLVGEIHGIDSTINLMEMNQRDGE